MSKLTRTNRSALCRFLGGLSDGALRRARVTRLRRPVFEDLEDRKLLSFTVNRTADDGSAGTLRWAISQANAAAGADMIDFKLPTPSTITLTMGELAITDSVIINGPPPFETPLTVSGNHTSRIFHVDDGNSNTAIVVSIQGLGLADGVAGSGGAIANAENLSLVSCTFSNNLADIGSGGAILNQIVGSPTLSVLHCTLKGNEAQRGGGGIENGGSLSVMNCVLSGNTQSEFGEFNGGGAIHNLGTAELTDCIVSGNKGSSGGGIDNVGVLALSNCTLSENTANHGGGIRNDGDATLFDCTLSHNSAESEQATFAGGGAIENVGSATLTGCTLSANESIIGGAAIRNSGGKAILTNCTLSHLNSGVPVDTPGIVAEIYNSAATSSIGLISCTVMATAANKTGAPVIFNAGTATLNDTIVATNLTKVDIQNLGTLQGSHNLISDGSGGPGLSSTITGDPLLGHLGNYGGSTDTLPLLPGSHAIDAGIDLVGVKTDQRGANRHQGNAPDIGAFESRGFIISPRSLDRGDPTVPATQVRIPLLVNHGSDKSQAKPLLAQVFSPFGEPVAGGQVTFMARSTGASASVIGSPTTIGEDGQAIVSVDANGVVGTYAVIARAAGAPDAVFAVSNVPPSTVLRLRRFGFHLQRTAVVLNFSEPMDSIRTEDLSNYALVAPGRDHRLGTRDDRVITVNSARYRAATRTVTLNPARRLPLRGIFRLTVSGRASTGLTDTLGVPLDGRGTFEPGTDFVTTFGRNNAVLSATHLGRRRNE